MRNSYNLTSLKWFVMFLVVLELNQEASLACFPIGNFKFNIYLISQLPKSSPPLYADCKSADTAFGNKTLTPGQAFNWRFCYKPYATLYTCDLVWDNRKKGFRAFDADHLRDYCDISHTLYWNVLVDGIYLSCNAGQLGDKLYSWG